jgi:hypothetical protein
VRKSCPRLSEGAVKPKGRVKVMILFTDVGHLVSMGYGR